MSITRLQQARQMYALGQRVRFRGGGRDASEADFDTPSADNTGNTGGGQVDTGDLGTEKANVQANIDANLSSRDRARSQMYTNMPTPTITIGVTPRGPIKVKTTYTDRRNRQLALDALNKKGISSFDPRVTKKNINFLDPNNLMTSFAPQQKKFGLFKDVIVPLGLTAINPALAAKYSKAKFAYNTAKNLANFAQTIGLTDKNVVDSFTSSFSDKFSDFGKGKKSSTKSSIDEDLSKIGNGNGGLESLGNMDALNQEYILLLNKFNSGNFTDTDQVRFTFLQKILGK